MNDGTEYIGNDYEYDVYTHDGDDASLVDGSVTCGPFHALYGVDEK